jgi:hypothetical protein
MCLKNERLYFVKDGRKIKLNKIKQGRTSYVW